MIKKYEFFEHTADAKFKAYGKNLSEAFKNAAYAFASLMYEPKDIAAVKIKKIDVHGLDMKQLLYNFLEEFLFLQDAEGYIFNNFLKHPVITDTGAEGEKKFRLTAEVIGDDIDEEYDIHAVVKAITYNDMEISEDPCYVQVILDI